MVIPTSRAKEPASIVIDAEKCSGCGICAEICPDKNLTIRDQKAVLTEAPLFGCIGCGHCMASCPENAIKIEGRFLSAKDLIPLPEPEKSASFESLLALFLRRRSVREFRDSPLEKELLDQILDAATTAPMGIPPSDVQVMVLDSKEKVRQFSEDYCALLDKMRWFFSGWFLGIMKLVWGKQTDELFRKFLKPLAESYTGHMKKGENKVMYDAPAALYFYSTAYTDPADSVIACTYAMIAAESMGLGTCMLGGIHPFIQKGRPAEELRKKYGIRNKSQVGLFLILGYPKFKYHKAIRRDFARVDFYN